MEIGPKAAEEIVSRAEVFVRTVEREFSLEAPANEWTIENNKLPIEDRGDDLTSPEAKKDLTELPTDRQSAEEIRRRAREDWLKNYYHKSHEANQAELQKDSRQHDEQKGAGKSQSDRDAGLDHDPE